MIYLISFFSGIINGIFASGAGQILIFYLIFIKKIDPYLGRAISISVLSISSIITLMNYSNFFNFNFKSISLIILVSLFFGFLGNKIMFRIKGNILNLISGLMLTILSIYGLLK